MAVWGSMPGCLWTQLPSLKPGQQCHVPADLGCWPRAHWVGHGDTGWWRVAVWGAPGQQQPKGIRSCCSSSLSLLLKGLGTLS